MNKSVRKLNPFLILRCHMGAIVISIPRRDHDINYYCAILFTAISSQEGSRMKKIIRKCNFFQLRAAISIGATTADSSSAERNDVLDFESRWRTMVTL